MSVNEESTGKNCCGEHADGGCCCGEHDGDECRKAPDSECACGCKHVDPEEFDYEAHDVPLPKPTTEEESKMIENVLSELRMLYVAALNEKNRRAQEGK